MKAKLQTALVALFCLLVIKSHAQKTPSPYPLYNIFRTYTWEGMKGMQHDTGLVTLDYDSARHLKYYKTYYAKNHYWQIDTMRTYSYDSSGAFMAIDIVRYDTLKSGFNKVEDIQARYDATGRVQYYKDRLYGSTPDNILRYYNYDALGRLSSYAIIDSSSGKNKYIIDYNKSSLDSFKIHQQLYNNKWINYSSTRMVYDSLKRPKQIFTFLWNVGTNAWNVPDYDSVAYDTSGWVYYSLTWDTGKHTWKNYRKIVYSGTPKSYCSLVYFWYDSVYRPVLDNEKDCIDYDSAGRLIRHGTPANAGTYYFESLRQYDASGRLQYTDTTFDFTSLQSKYYYYKKYNAIQAADQSSQKVSLFPNPNGGQFDIVLQNEFSGRLEIYSLTGQVLLQRNVSSEKSIHINEHLAAGMYVLQLRSEKEIYREKFVIKE